MVHTVFQRVKRAWNAKTECESTLNCQLDEFYRETDLFGSAPEEKLLWTSINPRDLSYTNGKCQKWSIWRILLICLTSQLTHKSTIFIFRHLLQLLWSRKRNKGSLLPCNLWIENKTGIADEIKKEVLKVALLKVALYSRSQNCTPCKQDVIPAQSLAHAQTFDRGRSAVTFSAS